jgi:hypothetical protein
MYDAPPSVRLPVKSRPNVPKVSNRPSKHSTFVLQEHQITIMLLNGAEEQDTIKSASHAAAQDRHLLEAASCCCTPLTGSG